MSDRYLLAASILTTGPMAVVPPPTLPPNLFDNLSDLIAATAARTWESSATHQIIPVVETTAPEFSNHFQNSVSVAPNAEAAETDLKEIGFFSPHLKYSTDFLAPSSATVQAVVAGASDLQTSLNPQPTTLSPTSGTQLYYQRFAALQVGKIYTRLSPDSFQPFWAKGIDKNGLPLPKPTHEQWKRLLEREAKAMAKGQGANRLGILVGDSLTQWFPSQRLPNSKFWLNQGISGENSTQILSRLSAFSQSRPDTIYVMAGTNDLRQGVSDRVILNNLRQIVRRLRLNHPKAQIIVQSILPTRLSAISSDRIYYLNQQIAVLTQQEGAGYLNLYNLFADEGGQLRRDLTTDGIHLTSRGYEVWQEALQYVESAIVQNGQELVYGS
ncbi:MAG TPA: acylhydrolase [Cyanobacteria bacterium UBA8803]|nr:acylhydrolase [Cyanobacteria bacterium UBA9273]HBL62702.1 acylhydrolase [Cyanobacteria bacterium UBA8803]